MQDVVVVETVHILAGDDVDLGVPLAVEAVEGRETVLHLRSEPGEGAAGGGYE